MVSSLSSDIQYNRANYYYFLGKVEPWAINNDEPNGGMIVDSDYENTRIRANMLFLKKITSSDISLVTKRYQWAANTVYHTWDHTLNMGDLAFYVITSTNDVFKCLSNNANAPSTVEPSEKSVYPVTTADGYIWKFMYSIPYFKVRQFITNEYIPVQRALSDTFYKRGAVDFVNVVEGGSGYTNGDTTYTTVTGATTGGGFIATVTVGTAGVITNVNVTNGGTGYTSGARLNITSAGGVDAVLEPVIVGGVITTVTITNGGFGYSTNDVVNAVLGGAIVDVSVDSNGTIVKATITDAGIGYVGNPTINVISPVGTGKYGNANAILQAVAFQGSIQHVNIIDPGIDLQQSTLTTIAVAGDGSGAVFTPVIKNGSLVDVIVESAGKNYTYISLTLIGTGTGAVMSPSLIASDYTSTQSSVEQTAIPGAIYAIKVTNQGNSYSSQATVVIDGDGTGAEAVATIIGGSITKITMTSYGKGYTDARISIQDPLRIVSAGVVDMAAYACLPPVNGHGFDAITELYGETLAINTTLRNETALTGLLQDYRQYGIVKNPSFLNTKNVFTNDYDLLAYSVQFNNVVDLVIDEVLLFGVIKYRVVKISGNVVTLQSLSTTVANPIGVLVAESNSSRVYSGVKLLSIPVSNKYTGKLLYIANEDPFSFTPEQGIVIKTFLKF
jgi:hypothetical protein